LRKKFALPQINPKPQDEEGFADSPSHRFTFPLKLHSESFSCATRNPSGRRKSFFIKNFTIRKLIFMGERDARSLPEPDLNTNLQSFAHEPLGSVAKTTQIASGKFFNYKELEISQSEPAALDRRFSAD
jgi:hypothetical protein